jgi:two-component system NtrC family sensor kinase
MWPWPHNSLTTRLTGTLIVSLVLLLAVTTVVQLGLQEHFSRECAQVNGLGLSETLYGALHRSMLANDREGLHAMVRTITEHAGNLRIRVFNKEGFIMFSSNPDEMGTRVNLQSEACYVCHAANQPLTRLPPGDRTRTFKLNGVPALGIIRPIDNEPTCYQAACHAHPASKRLLGVLDVTLLMKPIEEGRRQTAFLMVSTAAGVALLIVGIVVTVVRRNVHRPLAQLRETLDSLGHGDYSARYEDGHIMEFATLGRDVNRMARDLERANAELVEWAHTLERRVAEKTDELRRAQDQMVRVERMASLGKLAAVVAHEINNPLASVVTYSKLLLRRLRRQQGAQEREGDTLEVLQAISAESARCGEIVSNLLLFARRTGSHMEPTDVNQVARRALFLIKHKMDLARVALDLALEERLGEVVCDPAQVEQALLALCLNAIEAMPEGGTLTVRSATGPGDGVRLEVADTGVGMDDSVRAHIFEPFFTTKGEGEAKGLGLGLAVVYGIVQRHGGTIEVDSAPGRGTTFALTFPVQPPTGESGEAG